MLYGLLLYRFSFLLTFDDFSNDFFLPMPVVGSLNISDIFSLSSMALLRHAGN